MGWHNVEKLLEQVDNHSTLIGKYWITSFFLIRMLLALKIGNEGWDDSQSEFVCNTESPGCKNVCFNEFSPIALPSYWGIQLLFVALPSVMFIVYTAYKMATVRNAIERKAKQERDEKVKVKAIKQKEKEKARELGDTVYEDSDSDDDDEADDKDKDVAISNVKSDVPTKLFLGYFFMVLARLVIDICFMVGQYFLYTFKFVMPELFQCQHWPCPNVVDCFVNRPKEKTIFVCLFYTCCCIMCVLNVIELYHLADKFPRAWSKRHEDITKDVQDGPTFGGAYGGYNSGGYPTVVGIPTVYPMEFQDQENDDDHYHYHHHHPVMGRNQRVGRRKRYRRR